MLTSAVLSLLLTAVQLSAVRVVDEAEKGHEYWYDLGLQDLTEALKRPVIEGRAKNVVLLVGDGMGITVATAGRIMKGQKKGQPGEEGYLSFDRMPNVGLLKTYNVDKQVPDSAATATAFLSGVKANFYTMGLTANVDKDNCTESLVEENRAHSILMWAQQQGKHTGIVTNTRITHATPGAAYAGSPQREWECDANMKGADPSVGLCKDIARQLVEDLPGRKINVIMGGGRQPMGAQLPNSTSTTCKRLDGQNLALQWQQMRQGEGSSYAYVTNTQQLLDVNLHNTEYIMGLFAESQMSYSMNRDRGPAGQPSLTQMTTAALHRLDTAEHGYVLLVEGGRIDHGLHDGKPQLALDELVEFDAVVEMVLSTVNLQDTLVIVLADHSHGLTINGYPDRGNDILGSTSYEDGVTDGLPFTTLMFATGPGYNYTWDGQKVVRLNVTGIDTHSQDFMFPSNVPTKVGWSAHGGEDVGVYAAGPWAHLFHRVHEQSYVAHVIGYAAAIGPYAEQSARPAPPKKQCEPSPTAEGSTSAVESHRLYGPSRLLAVLVSIVATSIALL